MSNATKPLNAEVWRMHYWPLPSQGAEEQRNFIRRIQNDALNSALVAIERTWPEADDLQDAVKAMRDDDVE